MSSLLFALVCLQPSAEPQVRLPAEVAAPVGRIVKLTAEADGPRVRWYCPDADADLLPFPDSLCAAFAAAKPGRYRVLAWTAKGDVPGPPAVCVVRVDGPPPPPDPFVSALRDAYRADPSPDKARHLASLTALYRQAPATARDPDITTAGDLLRVLQEAARRLLPAEALAGVRAKIAAELRAALPSDPTTKLDAATRSATVAVFEKIAAALDQVP